MSSPGLVALTALACIHIIYFRPKALSWILHKQFLSAAAGMSLAYVLIDLLPALEHGQAVLKRTIDPLLPFLEHHTYLIALIGILFYTGISAFKAEQKHYWLPISGYLIYNFLIGTSLSDSLNPEIQPLSLFAIAIGLDFLVSDNHFKIFKRPKVIVGIILSLLSGYAVSTYLHIPDALIAVGISFSAGGIIKNVFGHQLEQKEKMGFLWFIIGAIFYSAILLNIGIP